MSDEDQKAKIQAAIGSFYQSQLPKPKKPKKKRSKADGPTEAQHQMVVARVLRSHEICFTHMAANLRNKVQGALLRRLGLSAGFPDLIIFDSPPAKPEMKGAAIEMKKAKGRLSSHQKDWLKKLQERQFCTMVAFGAEQALEFLAKLGYIPPSAVSPSSDGPHSEAAQSGK